jgi:hypothetical protein
MSNPTHAHASLIDAIGRDKVRAQFGLSPQRLHNWRIRGIPHTHRPAFAHLAILVGTPIPEGFLDPPHVGEKPAFPFPTPSETRNSDAAEAA